MSEINPYQASIYAEPAVTPRPVQAEEEFSPIRSLGTWTLVCSISAAPSFVIAMGIIPKGTWPAMVLGIGIFIVLYVLLDYRTRQSAFRRSRKVRYAIYATYVLRLIASIIFPIGTFIDLMCGFCSAFIVSPFQLEMSPAAPASGVAFIAVFIWTMTHAVVMHLVLFGVWILIWLFLKLTMGEDELPPLEAETLSSEKKVVVR
jgi:hypothetical protein